MRGNGFAGKLLQLVYADLLLSMEEEWEHSLRENLRASEASGTLKQWPTSQDFSRAARAAVHMQLHVACATWPPHSFTASNSNELVCMLFA